MLRALARHRLAQLLALPARRRPARSATSRRRRPRGRPGGDGRRPTSTPAGRPRWPSSSSTSTARRPTRASCVLDEVFHLEDQLARSTHRLHRQPRTASRRDMTTFADITERLEAQAIELPSWAFGNSGTRFKVFGSAGAPRTRTRRSPTPRRCTGSPGSRRRSRCTSRGTRSTTTPRSRAHAEDLGVALGTINSNTFQDDDYKLGSLTHADAGGARARRSTTSSSASTSWTRPGRATSRSGSPTAPTTPARTTSAAARTGWPRRCAEIYDRLGDDQRLVLEYKFFEPAFYPTDVPDWGTVVRPLRRARRAGRWSASTPATTRRAPTSSSSSRSCCGSGSSARSTSTRRFYADDDLIVGAADPFQLFRIMYEVVRGGGYGPDSDVAFMLDQCHNIEDKIPGQIRSVLNVQEMTARALLVDREALRGRAGRRRRARRQRGPHGRLLHRRARRPRRAGARRAACRPTRWRPTRASGYREQIAADRVGGTQAGWGA